MPRGAARPDPRFALIPIGLLFLAGVWLVVSALALHFPPVDAGRWNEVLVGLALMFNSSIRMVSPPSTRPLSIASIMFGLWLIASPFVVGYAGSADGREATNNAVIVGVLVTTLSALSRWLSDRRRSRL
jgi:hypothetical protein